MRHKDLVQLNILMCATVHPPFLPIFLSCFSISEKSNNQWGKSDAEANIDDIQTGIIGFMLPDSPQKAWFLNNGEKKAVCRKKAAMARVFRDSSAMLHQALISRIVFIPGMEVSHMVYVNIYISSGICDCDQLLSVG